MSTCMHSNRQCSTNEFTCIYTQQQNTQKKRKQSNTLQISVILINIFKSEDEHVYCIKL